MLLSSVFCDSRRVAINFFLKSFCLHYCVRLCENAQKRDRKYKWEENVLNLRIKYYGAVAECDTEGAVAHR